MSYYNPSTFDISQNENSYMNVRLFWTDKNLIRIGNRYQSDIRDTRGSLIACILRSVNIEITDENISELKSLTLGMDDVDVINTINSYLNGEKDYLKFVMYNMDVYGGDMTPIYEDNVHSTLVSVIVRMEVIENTEPTFIYENLGFIQDGKVFFTVTMNEFMEVFRFMIDRYNTIKSGSPTDSLTNLYNSYFGSVNRFPSYNLGKYDAITDCTCITKLTSSIYNKTIYLIGDLHHREEICDGSISNVKRVDEFILEVLETSNFPIDLMTEDIPPEEVISKIGVSREDFNIDCRLINFVSDNDTSLYMTSMFHNARDSESLSEVDESIITKFINFLNTNREYFNTSEDMEAIFELVDEYKDTGYIDPDDVDIFKEIIFHVYGMNSTLSFINCNDRMKNNPELFRNVRWHKVDARYSNFTMEYMGEYPRRKIIPPMLSSYSDYRDWVLKQLEEQDHKILIQYEKSQYSKIRDNGILDIIKIVYDKLINDIENGYRNLDKVITQTIFTQAIFLDLYAMGRLFKRFNDLERPEMNNVIYYAGAAHTTVAKEYLVRKLGFIVEEESTNILIDGKEMKQCIDISHMKQPFFS